MEHCSGGNLREFLIREMKPTLAEAIFYIIAVIEAVLLLHGQKIVHRDLKPKNILLSSFGHVKICNFGLSVMLSSSSESLEDRVGTPEYMAPEVLSTKPRFGFGVDWWAVSFIQIH